MVWQERAACRGVPVEAFFPDRRRDYKTVIELYCVPCPVRTECLLDAMVYERKAVHQRHGIWGGTTPAERVQLVRVIWAD